jgi:predicted TIM-barrel fold metal-dependent hydrolase
MANRIDTHFHIVPDFFAQAVEETGGDPSGWKTPTWSLEQAKDHMKTLGIKTAFTSITAPGTAVYSHDTKKARDLTRKCNDFAAKLRDDDPDKFGFFATLPPMTDVEGSLAEIDYAFNTLKADGVTVLTSYLKDGLSVYLGNELYHPIWEKLDVMNAVVFIHPTNSSVPKVNKFAPQPIFDYPQETTRTVGDLVLSGTKGKFPNMKMILSHAGGTIPFLAYRMMGIGNPQRSQQELAQDFRSFWYDTALSTSKAQLMALLELADPDRILFGSDVPYAPFEVCQFVTQNLDTFFDGDKEHQELLRKINYKNAQALFPHKFAKTKL